ncbi:MAG: hypothetical protein RIM84_01385 [Alphaproteobacteria bacterium]
MFKSKTMLASVAIAAAALSYAAPAFAGTTDVNLPAPGILGLVALGVISAIAIARGRK